MPALGEMVLASALAHLGCGEVGRNNNGPFVLRCFQSVLPRLESMRDAPGDGSWCAAFVSLCYVEACERLSIPLPFRPSLGARTLHRRIVAAGQAIDPLHAQPGDVVCWRRGDRKSPFGHIGIVERVDGGLMYTVEGNVGAFPAVVRRMTHDISRDTKMLGCARPEPRLVS